MISISKYAIDIHAQTLPKNLSVYDVLEIRYVVDVESGETLHSRYILENLEISPGQFNELISFIFQALFGMSRDEQLEGLQANGS